MKTSVYRNFGFPGADDMANMFQFNADFEAEYCGARDINATKKLNYLKFCFSLSMN